MSSYRPKFYRAPSYPYESAGYGGGTGRAQPTGVARPRMLPVRSNVRFLIVVVGVVFATNVLSHTLFNPALGGAATTSALTVMGSKPSDRLYLMDQASLFAPNPEAFEAKVRETAAQLNIPAEWLMAVMYSESKFDAGVRNFKGSGATGLIQFMPAVAAEMGVSTDQLAMMGHVGQMDYVYRYLQTVRTRYGGFGSLTDLYLGILYPKALNQDYCYTLYARPSKAFKQNSGLDENADGRVTVSDIDRRMQRLYPEAYMAQK